MTALNGSARQKKRDAMILSYSGAPFVALAAQIAGFEQVATPSPRSGNDNNAARSVSVNLADYLVEGQADPILRAAVPTKRLSVWSGVHRVLFDLETPLQLAELGDDRFFRLPTVLREAGCEAWVCGVALIDSFFSEANTGEYFPAIWIDLECLAATVLKQKGLDK